MIAETSRGPSTQYERFTAGHIDDNVVSSTTFLDALRRYDHALKLAHEGTTIYYLWYAKGKYHTYRPGQDTLHSHRERETFLDSIVDFYDVERIDVQKVPLRDIDGGEDD